MPLVQAATECEFPSLSALDCRWVNSAYFLDSYRISLSRQTLSVVEIFHAAFAHHPMWVKVVLIVRNQIASLCGLDAPTASEVLNPVIKDSYAVGGKIGVWPIFALSDVELIAGRNNKHLDFRLSVLREVNDTTARAVISTVCVVHNAFGKVYLFFIVPFHKWGVRRLLSRAAIAGRL